MSFLHSFLHYLCSFQTLFHRCLFFGCPGHADNPTSFISFHSSIIFHLLSLFLYTFHQFSQKSDHSSLFCARYKWSSHVKRVTVLFLRKRKYHPNRCKLGKVHTVCVSVSVSTWTEIPLNLLEAVYVLCRFQWFRNICWSAISVDWTGLSELWTHLWQ